MCPAVPTMIAFISLNLTGSGASIEKTNRPQMLMTGSLASATIEAPHDHRDNLFFFSGRTPAARPHVRGIRKNQAAAWKPRAYAHRARHLQRHVERALLV